MPFSTSPSGNAVAANHLLTAGLAITCTSAAALNGTYPAMGLALSAMQAEMDSLTRNANTFVDGTTSVQWPDRGGTAHTFTVAQFGELINAINQFVVQCYQYAEGIGAAPSGSATIA
jgi:hypothetical protein